MTAATCADILALSRAGHRHAWTVRDAMTYAHAIGLGRDPFDAVERRYVWSRPGPVPVVPGFAFSQAVHDLIYPYIDVPKMVQLEQQVVLHQPLPAAAEVEAEHRVIGVEDKGAAKGLVLRVASRVRTQDGAPLYDVLNVHYARGDGGKAQDGSLQRLERPWDDFTMPAARPRPDRAPDLVRSTVTQPNQALLYHLVGDRNDVHGDPELARRLGFAGPILHGACSLGIACREILAGLCGYDAARIAALGTSYTAVGYPGEELVTDLWVEGSEVWFRTRAPARGAVVLDRGTARLR